MKKFLDTTLAYATLTLLMLACLLLCSVQLSAQEPMVLRLGTTMTEAKGTLERLPFLSKEASESELTIQNAYMKADYSFAMGELEKIRIIRDYASEYVAAAALDGYLVYLGRINATLVPVIRSSSETVYYAMTEGAHYELKLEKASRKKTTFTVLVQSRIETASNTHAYTELVGWNGSGETALNAMYTK